MSTVEKLVEKISLLNLTNSNDLNQLIIELDDQIRFEYQNQIEDGFPETLEETVLKIEYLTKLRKMTRQFVERYF